MDEAQQGSTIFSGVPAAPGPVLREFWAAGVLLLIISLLWILCIHFYAFMNLNVLLFDIFNLIVTNSAD